MIEALFSEGLFSGTSAIQLPLSPTMIAVFDPYLLKFQYFVRTGSKLPNLLPFI